MANEDIEYKVSYLDIPTQAEGFQTIVLIEHEKMYGFASYSNRWKGYFLVSDEYAGRMKKRMLEENVKPISIFDKETKSLIEKIISYVNLNKNSDFLKEENSPISMLLQKISK